MRWNWIDRIIEMQPGKTARGVRRFSSDDPIFEEHFPGDPVVPGVIQIEMIAQVARAAVRAVAPDRRGLLSKVRSARFHRPLRPETEALISSEVLRQMSQAVLIRGRITVEGELVSEAELLVALVPQPPSQPTGAPP